MIGKIISLWAIAGTLLPGQISTNTHRLAAAAYDRGPAPAGLALDRMVLVLQRTPVQQAQLDELLREQQTRGSANYRRWLTPAEFGSRFGADDADIAAATGWLVSQGFRIGEVPAGRGTIEFSGNAGQVEAAFHAPIHQFVAGGEEHWANASDPEIPDLLRGVVAGIATLHDFHSRPAGVVSGARPQPDYSIGWYYNALAPADFNLIYNVAPLFEGGITGAGAHIAIAGRSNIHVPDVNDFRSIFGLPVNPPVVVLNGRDPTDLGGSEETEALLDNSWAGATAPGAAIEFVISASTNASDGALLSAQYIVNHNDTLTADVLLESFSLCEADVTSAQATLLAALAQQAAAEGIAYVVSAGDTGSTGCESSGEAVAGGPLSVNAYASSPYVTAVGGTQFNENAGAGPYWAESSLGPYYWSVYSYIPEDAWNWSCAAGQCSAKQPNISATGGGASTLYGKPAWQTGLLGVPNDGARDLPDVSLTASASHDAYLLCIDGGCSGGIPGFTGVGGTSAAAAAFAGMMALVRQKAGSPQGSANLELYSMAAAQEWPQCNASNGIPPSSCVFQDVTVGNNSVPGGKGYGTAGAPYQAGAGYDLATGLGSLNAANLVGAWGSVETAWAAVSPQSLTFAQALGGASGAQTIALSNAGNAALAISSVGITGPGAASFHETNHCGSTLAAGGSCTVSVTFTPSALGSVTAVLQVSGSAPGSPYRVGLNGTGTGVPAIAMHPAALAFAAQAPGTGSAGKMGTFTNSGTAALQIAGIALGGANPRQFVLGYNCPISLNAGASCSFTVFFKPRALGAKNATVTMVDNAAGSPHSVVLTGTAVQPTVKVTPAGVAFGSQAVDGSAVAQTVVLTNTSSVTLLVSGVALAGTNANQFTESGACATVNPGASCALSIAFRPTASGAKAASLTVADNAVGSPQTLVLTGTGITPGVRFSPASLAFGSLAVGSYSAAKTVTLTNSGTVALTIGGIALTGVNANQFSESSTCHGSLSAGASCTISVAFRPGSAGAKTAAVSVTDNAAGGAQSIALTGTGLTP